VPRDTAQEDGEFFAPNCSQCPATMALLRSLPLCDCAFGCAFFSCLAADSSIAPHTGPTNVKLRLQLPLLLPSAAAFALTVAGETRTYRAMQPLLFDDSYVHAVSSSSSSVGGGGDGGESERVVLVVDLWHPGLQPSHKRILRHAFSSRRLLSAESPPSLPAQEQAIQATRSAAVQDSGGQQPEHDYLLKLLIVGMCGVGKSAFVLR
jgi:aspartyl/asparaginyl beta-hydroxylase (cupin superfamily)